MAHAKKRRRKSRLYRKYITFLFAIELVSLSTLGIVLAYFVTDTWEDEQKQKLYDYSVNIADAYETYLSSDVASAEVFCYTLSSISSAAQADIFVADTGGTIVFCRHMTDTEDAVTGKITCETHSKTRIPAKLYTEILEHGMMATRMNFGEDESAECFISAAVASKTGEARADGIVFAVQTIRTGLIPYQIEFAQIYVLSILAFLIISGLIIYVSTYNMTRPIREMSEATKHYSKGDFSYRIKREKTNAVREFDELSSAVNSMADNLKKLEEARTNFIANVSHELKTPMTTIGGFIDGILDGTIDYEHQEYYLRIVSDEVKRISRLIGSMLNMSKMEAGEITINPVRFNLTQQILGIFISFEQKINEKDLSIKGLDYLMNIYVEADSDMINQVFYNLIDNAVKFADRDGEISVSMESGEEFVSVKIRNTGAVIPDEDLIHVFDRFYKADKSRSLDTKSVGLGLFIVKNIVELHKGEIEVRNIDNKYTEFEVKLRLELIGK